MCHGTHLTTYVPIFLFVCYSKKYILILSHFRVKIQSIFRVYRFGQMKPCYIYRFLAMGTMEEKIYERQVTKLAISKRVIDEQQIDRHYKAKDLNELYMTNLDVDDERPPAALPKDLLFAELLRKFDKLIYKYHEQDSLLENKEEETLSKAEIEAAWEEYEQEKTRKPIVQMNSIPVQYPRGLYTIQSTIHFHAINGIHLSHFYLTFR